MTMNALYIRFFCAVLLLASAMLATTARAAESTPIRAASSITGIGTGRSVANPNGGTLLEGPLAWASGFPSAGSQRSLAGDGAPFMGS